jgi:hypothetical protein
MNVIDPEKFFAPQKIVKVPRAYESLNPGLRLLTKTFFNNCVCNSPLILLLCSISFDSLSFV